MLSPSTARGAGRLAVLLVAAVAAITRPHGGAGCVDRVTSAAPSETAAGTAVFSLTNPPWGETPARRRETTRRDHRGGRFRCGPFLLRFLVPKKVQKMCTFRC